MFAHAFSLIAILASAFVARADVTPSEPSPGRVYNAGATCPIIWLGDKDSPTAWKNMTIELMSGDNFNMIHITTVAANQDGTVDGSFSYTCPSVTPNSAIYFYQFTSPGSPDKTWTTRFTIASATGSTTPPANATQPDGENVPWGVGALTDPSQAVPPPGSSGAASGASSSSSLAPSSLTSLSSAGITANTPANVTPGSSRNLVTAIASASSSAPSTTGTDGGSSGAIALSATSAATTFIVPLLAFFLF